MALSCGCEFRGGMGVSPELLQEHYKHTMEALFFWELLLKLGRDPLATLDLYSARVSLMDAIDKLYPEAVLSG